MKPILICSSVLIFFFSCSIKSQPFHLNDLTLKESKFTSGDTNKINLSEKSPLFAGALSFTFPGLAFGQLYNNQPGKFVIHTCITGICAAVGALGLANLNIDVGGGGDGDAFGGWVFLFAAAVFAGNWTWSVVDAVVTANNINKQVKMQKNRSGVLDKLKFGFSVDKNKQLNFKFALEL